MIQTRTSRKTDIPQLKELWKLAFGDSDAYIDHFYDCCYTPERMLVLEEHGVVKAMTAWFSTTLKNMGHEDWKAAYLYAVATHPDSRGKGYAGRLLAWADEYLGQEQGFDCVTTVPARPDLHLFFGKNGFRECFVLTQRELERKELPEPPAQPILQPVTAQEYGAVREQLLEGSAHVAYDPVSLDYQAGCCRMSGGGLYRGQTAAGPICLCAEGAGNGLMVLKEFLGTPAAVELAQGDLMRILPADRWLIRTPAEPREAEPYEFAMLKWLEPEPTGWDRSQKAYLGLAFD